jgi:hypothetical protein
MSTSEDDESSPRSQTREELEAELARARERVAEVTRALGDDVARVGDWRGWVRDRPGISVAAALGLGFTVGGGLATPLGRRLLGLGLRAGAQLVLLPAVERALLEAWHAGNTPAEDPDETRH